ncbi:MAG: peptidase domain-containing ABC transporter [Chryseobacterium sp.]|uniref:peptidase domain-containing ABC transporter n=1 Tax=Chryseobacterium sp. TaxID=1871047 RepID=UPI0025C61036|nr:peptidase domain-containing ABC transporter [Chryseobacterium sp.]MCJ7932654.1 peptidase domain-containing ABC transporter [Chryseobacterium sp.]
MLIDNFPYYPQVEHSDCGAACLKIILKYYGKNCDISYLRELTQVTRAGISLNDIIKASKVLHFKTNPVMADIVGLKDAITLPAIVHWEQDHFVVLYKIKNNKYYISDPNFGKLSLHENEFLKLWSDNNNEGIAIELEPTPAFSEQNLPYKRNNFEGIREYILNSVKDQKNKIFWLSFLICLSTIISFVFPKTIQNLFDNSIKVSDQNQLFIIFGFQLLLFFSQTIVNLIQNFIGVHFSTQVSIKILSNLLNKIVKLPIYFFENRLYTDILQKIEDQSKIEQLLTKQLITAVFSVFLFVALSCRLFLYNVYLGSCFVFLIIFTIFWMFFFYNRRKIIDYYSFKLTSENRNNLTEMITGMVSIKISNAQSSRLQKWHTLQNKIYSLKVRSLILESYQNYTTSFIKQLFSITLTFVCAYWVMNKKITVGEMMSIGYIMGLISLPIENIIVFLRSLQDSKLVYNRTQEIYKSKDETESHHLRDLPISNSDIILSNISYKYFGGSQPLVLKNITAKIPKGKVTAIVGSSGSGKTTLLKLLLGFYPTTEGKITIDGYGINSLDKDWWRSQCGVVMQDNNIFSGSIAENISMDTEWDLEKLIYATKIAQIFDFIENLPLGFETKIGNTGVDLSGGQKQRIMIARAVYKDPQIIFFDEATSSLDSTNESLIMANLQRFFKGKTVLIIAHRLSTVKNADQIIVLDNGRIIETGPHQQLVSNRKNYYELVKNQLELGVN